MNKKRKDLIKKCEDKLLDLKYRYQFILANKNVYEGDMSETIDRANNERDKYSSILIREKMRILLPEINMALKRIEEGTYGYCIITGDEIESSRLIAVPWTNISIEAMELEKAS